MKRNKKQLRNTTCRTFWSLYSKSTNKELSSRYRKRGFLSQRWRKYFQQNHRKKYFPNFCKEMPIKMYHTCRTQNGQGQNPPPNLSISNNNQDMRCAKPKNIESGKRERTYQLQQQTHVIASTFSMETLKAKIALTVFNKF